MPVPIGLVSSSTSPSCAVLLRFRLVTSQNPFTDSPSIGSVASMLCPPASGMPAAAHTALAPSSALCASATGRVSTGQPSIASASTGVPPIAYTSLMAFAAAIRPKSNASSTMGIKKSVVAIRAFPFPISYTAASSAVALPTSSFAVCCSGIVVVSICCSTAGAILQPHPAPRENWVSLISSLIVWVACLLLLVIIIYCC